MYDWTTLSKGPAVLSIIHIFRFIKLHLSWFEFLHLYPICLETRAFSFIHDLLSCLITARTCAINKQTLANASRLLQIEHRLR